ncbi:MAG: hypothetical protein ACLR07_03155 [Christensenellales bacterium]
MESRLDLLRRLNRKYGATTQDMIRYRDKIEAELSELEDSDEAAEAIGKGIPSDDAETGRDFASADACARRGCKAV